MVLTTASWPRRFLALFVDWVASSLVVAAIWGPAALSQGNVQAFYVHLVFLAECTLFNTLLAGSFGKLVTGLRVVRMDAQGHALAAPVSLWRSFVRTLLILLVIPPLVFKSDGRGLHDLATGTAAVPRNQG